MIPKLIHYNKKNHLTPTKQKIINERDKNLLQANLSQRKRGKVPQTHADEKRKGVMLRDAV